ncbi:methyl-accepting chemotaxis protein [Gracilibacillus sp. S3-1-1]|uniref:Methyl-accepting chemotaxis protein n=1 Tax=Gracilibacillus pellucidus TaxID=3095368 RepID=A0ACC6M321_9BACI|nr:methyl-accepting chemotaxis protein [Gracilibacillus sp. S3-1-1]MDX8045354.1 methyl-accepting chemotaxis protein [Gracilibacillus sp. S3-1-1]
MNSSLQAVVNIAPIIKETIGPTSAMAIIDTEKFVYFEPSTVLNLDVAVGTPAIPDIEQYARAIKGEKFSDTTLDPTIFGAPVVTDILPIKDDNNEIVGLLSLSRTLEHKVRIDKEMESINNLIDGLQGKVQHVAAQAEELSATSNEISDRATHANDNSKHIGEVVQLIDQISNQTNLLGLNAAIEAARSGEAGKGFSLVADKIRKLSDNTRNAVKTIDTSVNEIRSSMENLTLSIKEVSSSSEEQSKIMVEFMDDIQNLDNKSKKIVSLMKNITNQN